MRTDRAELKRRARQALKGNYGTAIGGLILFYIVYWFLAMAIEVIGVVFIAMGGLMGGFAEAAAGASFMSEDSLLVIVYLVVFFAVMYLLIGLIVFLMMPGLIQLYMNICKGKKAKCTDIFWVFQNKPWKFAGISLGYSLIMFVIGLPSTILSIAGSVTGDVIFVAIFNIAYSVIIMILSIYVTLTFSMFFYILVEDPRKSWIQALAESRRMMIGNRLRFLGLGFSFLGWMCLGMMSFGIGMLWLMPYMSCTSIYFYLDLQPQIETIPPETSWNPYMEGFEELKGEEVLDFTENVSNTGQR